MLQNYACFSPWPGLIYLTMRRKQDTDEHGKLALSLAALGIVFGDIGTSPLYAFKACFQGPPSVAPTPENVLGLLSLFFWSLIIVISLKYVLFVMRADNHGEGGLFALYALLPGSRDPAGKGKGLMLLALFGSALLYGDGFITPAISVLSALEGLAVAAPSTDAYIVPVTCVVLACLFLIQQRGTAAIGKLFGPVMLLWFAVLGVMGAAWIVREPQVLLALRPYYAAHFFMQNGATGFLLLGAVVLCVTGGEALYADMGHFGRIPIQLAWYGAALPGLVLNYFGQGARILRHAGAATDPFYGMAPKFLIYPLTILATAAAIIASQAIISGVFSLTRQAIQLGYLPRLHILHTSDETEGQIFVPEANWLMAVVCLILVLNFRTSEHLAGAYGIAITATMAVTSIMYGMYLVQVRSAPKIPAFLLTGVFLVFDLSFFGANAPKIVHGGWIPVLTAVLAMIVMISWKYGRLRLKELTANESTQMQDLLERLEADPPPRVPGMAVFMTLQTRFAPPVLLWHLQRNKSLHQNVVLLTIVFEPVPYLNVQENLVVKVLGQGFHRLIARCGFMQSPRVPLLLGYAYQAGLKVNPQDITYYISRETIVPPKHGRLKYTLFRLMNRNAMSPALYFDIPSDQIIELGVQVAL